MSEVADAILLYGLSNGNNLDGPTWLLHVNAFFNPAAIVQGSADGAGFVHVESGGHWYGGDKTLQANVAIGAFNHLDVKALVAHIRSLREFYEDHHVKWCQVVLKCEHNDCFEIVDVFRDQYVS